jgi:hypothetical protein
MRQKLMSLFVLAMLAGNAMAEWTVVGKISDSTEYVDKSTARRSGTTVKMWDLSDFVTLQKVSGYEFYSMSSLIEYDCLEKRSRRLQLTAYSGQMRTGKVVVSSSNIADWSYVEPSSHGELKLSIACKR